MLVNFESSQLLFMLIFAPSLHFRSLFLLLIFALLLLVFNVCFLLFKVVVFDFVLDLLFKNICKVARFGSHTILPHLCDLILRKFHLSVLFLLSLRIDVRVLCFFPTSAVLDGPDCPNERS